MPSARTPRPHFAKVLSGLGLKLGGEFIQRQKPVAPAFECFAGQHGNSD